MTEVKTYTGTWALKHQAPYILKPKMQRPRRTYFHEVVGEVEEKKMRSFFIEDMPFYPSSAPILERLVNEDKVVPDEKSQTGKDLKLSYLVCRQCSAEFTSKSHNRLYCKECASLRKKVSDSNSSKKRYKKQGKLEYIEFEYFPTDSCVGETIGKIRVDSIVNTAGNRSLYSCVCECGTTFTASHAALRSNALQMCPQCLNLQNEHRDDLLESSIYDTSRDDDTSIFSRSFGFLQAKVKINNSLALCNCGCGNRVVVQTANLLDGSVKDCGCGYNDCVDDKAKSVMIGRKIGLVTVLAAMKIFDVNKSPMNRFFKCRCECGNDFIVPRRYFTVSEKNTRVLTCGCELKTYTQR